MRKLLTLYNHHPNFLKMTSNTLRWHLIALLLPLFFTSNAQKSEDLGRIKPFLIGLKGTIYNFSFKGSKNGMELSQKSGYYREIEQTEPIGYVYTQSLNISERELTQPFPGVPKGKSVFAIIYTGNFEVSDSAEFFFGLKSDDGSRLWIDGKEVINNDGLHQFSVAGAGKIRLSKGIHAIKVWYFQGLPTRMGLVLVMKKSTDKDFQPFDLKKYEDDIKQSIDNQEDTTAIHLKADNKILFETGKSDVKEADSDWLMSIARILIFNPQSKVRIEGHTDNVGTTASNQLLSENRAKAVLDALKKLGVTESVAFTVKGFGETQPLAPNNSEDGRSKNRRVEVFIEK